MYSNRTPFPSRLQFSHLISAILWRRSWLDSSLVHQLSADLTEILCKVTLVLGLHQDISRTCRRTCRWKFYPDHLSRTIGVIAVIAGSKEMIIGSPYLTLILWNSLIYTILKPCQILCGEYESQASILCELWLGLWRHLHGFEIV